MKLKEIFEHDGLTFWSVAVEATDTLRRVTREVSSDVVVPHLAPRT